MAKKRTVEHEHGDDNKLAEYEKQLANYLQDRIKPGLSPGAIPLLARSIAKDIARRDPPEEIAAHDSPQAGNGPAVDFEEDMHELQAELGDDWILRFSVHGEDGWLTAENQNSNQRIEGETADELLKAFDEIDSEG
jgi:hypothetical protein